MPLEACEQRYGGDNLSEGCGFLFCFVLVWFGFLGFFFFFFGSFVCFFACLFVYFVKRENIFRVSDGVFSSIKGDRVCERILFSLLGSVI